MKTIRLFFARVIAGILGWGARGSASLRVAMRALFDHVVYFAETYLVLPVVLLLIVGSLHFYQWATGRPSIDDPAGEIVGSLQALTPLVLLIALVGFVQSRILGYRGEKEGAAMRDDVFDAVVFVGLLFSFAKIGRML